MPLYMLALRKNSLNLKLNGIKHIPILVICLLFLNYLTSAQALNTPKLNSKAVKKDSISKKDSSSVSFPISKDKLEFAVKYDAKDSIVYYAKKKTLYLHNNANISYDNIKIQSDFIEYEQDSSRLSALEIDSLTNVNDTSENIKSTIAQGEETSTFSSLFYNFKSKRALIENAYSQYGEGFILSQQVKRNNDNTINGLKNIYTTCNDPHPHFGISTKRIKIIPNKVAVAGSANLVIEDIPTPLYLPFGLFPLKQGQRSGFQLPTYSMTQNLGFGLTGGGYYFAISDHVDLLAIADIYALGTWRAGFVSNYNYKYRFRGNMSFNYGYNKIGESYEPGNQNSRNYNLTWTHSIDPNVIPGSTFSAYVNIGSNKYQQLNSFDANQILNSTYNSSISYSKSWKNRPFNFATSLRHTQQTATGYVNLTLPEISFSVNQIFPFLWRKNVIKPRWYERITATYQLSTSNQLTFYDSIFSLSTLRFQDFNNGMKHTIPINASYNVLKYFNLTFNATYNEYWYSKKQYKEYNFTENKLDTTLSNGFYSARDFNAGASLSTRIYGIKLFKKGLVRGIRHVITPNIGLNYQPDFGSDYYNFYYSSFVDRNYRTQKLSYFDGSIYGGPPNGKVGGVSFGLGNTLSMKVRSKKDTVNGGLKKINLIDGLNVSTFYNMAIDSFKWSRVAISYRTTLFENISMSGSMSYDPYSINKATGLRSNVSAYKANNKLLRFENANLSLTASLPFKKGKSSLQNASDNQKMAVGNNLDNYADFNIPWSLNISYSLNVNKNFIVKKQADTLLLNQNIIFVGDVNLTPKWKIGLRSGYDFATKKISFSTLDIYRDLHCWEMKFNTIIFGTRRSYNFGLNVKASVLQDLKLTRRKDFRDFL